MASPGDVCKKDVLKNFAKFTVKRLCYSLIFNKVAGCLRWSVFAKIVNGF